MQVTVTVSKGIARKVEVLKRQHARAIKRRRKRLAEEKEKRLRSEAWRKVLQARKERKMMRGNQPVSAVPPNGMVLVANRQVWPQCSALIVAARIYG